MARVFRGPRNESADKDLTLRQVSPNCISIDYTPSQELIGESNLTGKDKTSALSKSHTLMLINGKDDFITIFPLNTLPTHPDFLEKKYTRIESIKLEGLGYETPENISEVVYILEEFPPGFIKDYEYGLGLLKDYRTIITSIEEIPNIKHLVITEINTTEIDGEYYFLSFSDFEAARKGINRISENYQKKSRVDKINFSYNSLLSQIDTLKYPEKKNEYTKDVLYKLISSTSFDQASLSKGDSSAVINIVSSKKDDLYKNKKEEIIQAQRDIELLDLSWLTEESERLLIKNSSENEWQTFFNDNPIMLFLVFGYPVIKVQDQASVGGRRLSGSGDKITDFLVKNNLTNNSALVEIKKPGTPLLKTNGYRGGVYSPSHGLSGSVNQILDQKYKFQKEISLLKDSTGIYDIESYAVDCVLIIGRLPSEKEKMKSFEMYRHNSKDVRIYTFDEIVSKLKNIYTFLQDDSRER